MPQTTAPVGTQSAWADGAQQPDQAWGWSASAGGIPGQAPDRLPDAWAARGRGSWAEPSPGSTRVA
eukprot:12114060-Alexandrium_andersonii.AAC.1